MVNQWASALLTLGVATAAPLVAGEPIIGQVQITRGVGAPPDPALALLKVADLPNGLEVSDASSGSMVVYQVEVPPGLAVTASMGADAPFLLIAVDRWGRQKAAGLLQNRVRNVTQENASFENHTQKRQTAYFVVGVGDSRAWGDMDYARLVLSQRNYLPISYLQRSARPADPLEGVYRFRITFAGSRIEAAPMP